MTFHKPSDTVSPGEARPELNLGAVFARNAALYGTTRMEDAGAAADPPGGESGGTPPADPPAAPPADSDEVAAAKKVNRDLERKMKAAYAERDALAVELAAAKKPKPKAPPAGDPPVDVEALRVELANEANAAATARANERILRAEIKVAATGKLADPADAPLFLDLAEFTVGEDGSVDESALADAIDDLITKKPHLGAQGTTKGSGDGGTRNGQRPAQLSKADLAGMSPEAINTARAEGRLNDLLGFPA